MENIFAQSNELKPRASKVPLFTFVARIVSLVSLVVSLAILKGNNYADNAAISAYFYNVIGSYQYMFACVLVGLGYTVLQTPFAAYYAFRNKPLVNHYGFLVYEFYADKAILCILGTALGAGFGVTKDFKYVIDQSNNPDTSDFDNFFNMNYLASGFLLIGFICSVVLSLFSSRPASVDK